MGRGLGVGVGLGVVVAVAVAVGVGDPGGVVAVAVAVAVGVGLAGVDVAVAVGVGLTPPQLPSTLNTIIMFGNPMSWVGVGTVTPQSAALKKLSALWPSGFEPTKNRLPTAVPSGVITSITSSSVPAATVAVIA